MKLVARYIARLMLVRIVAVVLVLTALLQIMDLIDNVDEVLDRRDSIADIVVYAGYRLPTIVETTIPIAVLLGTIAAFLALAGRSELDALRSGGISQTRVVLLCLPVCLLFVGVHFLLVDRVVPASQQAFTQWWDGPINSGDAVWLRDDASFVSVTEATPSGRHLEGVTIYRRDGAGDLVARIEAATADYDDGVWTLGGVEEQRFEAGAGTEVRRHDTLAWPDGPAPHAIGILQQPPERLSADLMTGLLSGAWTGATETASYRTELANRYAAPLASLVMLLLASPAMRRQGRSSAALIGGLTGLALGLGFVVVGGILTALGRAGILAPEPAAWLPVAAFAITGLVLLRRSET
ncbi:MAG: LPS export ABC transporter permease LptG [Pseudomonadota bacterium]